MAFLPTPASPSELEAQLKARTFGRPGEAVAIAFLWLCGLVSLVTTAAIVIVLFEEAFKFFGEVSFFEFIGTVTWQPLFEPAKFGIWELVFGTMAIVFWSMVFALPLGIAAAVYMSEYAHPRTRKVLKPMLEALAGVPTVVYAFFALNVVTEELLRPLFGAERVGIYNVAAASLVMAVAILPIIASVSEDAMANVPRELREAAYGLGSTRLEVAFKVVVPAALSGIIAAVLLAISRVIGETMIVAIAAGSTPSIEWASAGPIPLPIPDPFASIQTMTSYMLQVGLGDAAQGTTQYTSLFAVGATLFLFTFSLNVLASYVVRRFREAYD